MSYYICISSTDTPFIDLSLSIYRSVYRSIHLLIHPLIDLAIHLPFHGSVYITIYLLSVWRELVSGVCLHGCGG